MRSDAAVNPDSVCRFVAEVSGPVDQVWLDKARQFDFYDQPAPTTTAADGGDSFQSDQGQMVPASVADPDGFHR
ncbi:hypothetical protein GAN17_16710 [Mycobacterium kubicae]|uniref:hypothetical protein n=1 Tax=Mycobacterium kubicae TaxID=120959 RepID=UPI0016422866|nr:hypothetical protein [Mycobacterium kubicae]QNI07743.1 hypothetical protein GAN17_16710 [Mycobacterium kubicae]